jgi:hypothetical protein
MGVRFAPNVPLALKSLLGTPDVLLGGVDQVEVHFSMFRDSVNSKRDRCKVCVKCTIGS